MSSMLLMRSNAGTAVWALLIRAEAVQLYRGISHAELSQIRAELAVLLEISGVTD